MSKLSIGLVESLREYPSYDFERSFTQSLSHLKLHFSGTLNPPVFAVPTEIFVHLNDALLPEDKLTLAMEIIAIP